MLEYKDRIDRIKESERIQGRVRDVVQKYDLEKSVVRIIGIFLFIIDT